MASVFATLSAKASSLRLFVSATTASPLSSDFTGA
ncbi:Uncharacterised protein [Vibrio cholerae]|nr:Uncharacterised protein [Vibrio cholerae]